jgi:glycerol-3-phosphate dehydrogenase (NAD(P)+)
MLWSRDAHVADGINRDHRNPDYVREFRLPAELRATSDLDEAITGSDLLVVGVPTSGFREVVRKAAATVGPGCRWSAWPRGSRRRRCCG